MSNDPELEELKRMVIERGLGGPQSPEEMQIAINQQRQLKTDGVPPIQESISQGQPVGEQKEYTTLNDLESDIQTKVSNDMFVTTENKEVYGMTDLDDMGGMDSMSSNSYKSPNRQKIYISEADMKGNVIREKLESIQCIPLKIEHIRKMWGPNAKIILDQLSEQIEKRLTIARKYKQVVKPLNITAQFYPSKMMVLLRGEKTVTFGESSQYYEGYFAIQLTPGKTFRAGGERGDL